MDKVTMMARLDAIYDQIRDLEIDFINCGRGNS